MERKYSFFQAPFLAFCSTDLYRDVAHNWKGSGALYMFLLSTIAWALSALSVYFLVTQILSNRTYLDITEQIPGITLQDGKLSLDRPTPYDIKDKGTGISYVRFDTQRRKEKMIVGDPAIVATQSALLASTEELEKSKSRQASNYPDAAGNGDKDAIPAKVIIKWADSKMEQKMELDKTMVQTNVQKILMSLPIGWMIVGWPFVFIAHLIQLLIFGGIAALVSSMMQREVRFETAMRLAAIAMTPAIVISTLLTAGAFMAPSALLGAWSNYWFAAPIITIVYIIVILRAIPNADVPR